MPDEWLDPPAHMADAAGNGEPTHVVVQDDGRVYGHVATFKIPLTRPDGTKFTLPRDLDLNMTMQGHHVTASGEVAAVGMLMTDRSHTDLNLPLDIARDKFGHVGNQFAQGRFGYDRTGLWFAGALTPGVPARSVVAARGGSLSGEWFPIVDGRGRWDGRYEFLGAQVVNYPGLALGQSADRSRYGIAAARPGAFLAGNLPPQYDHAMPKAVTAAVIPAGSTITDPDGKQWAVVEDITVDDTSVDAGAEADAPAAPFGAAAVHAAVTEAVTAALTALGVTADAGPIGGDMAKPEAPDMAEMLAAFGDGIATIIDLLQKKDTEPPAADPEDEAALAQATALL